MKILNQFGKIYKNNSKIVLGIDCGIATTGWSIVMSEKNNFKAIDFGVIKTAKSENMPKRLKIIFDECEKLIKKFKPDEIAVESLFYFKNQKTVISVSQARGIILLCSEKNKRKVFDYTPLQVKMAICGYGKAQKDQVQRLVKMLFKLKSIPKPDDAADALAISYCHLINNTRLQ